MFFERLNNTIQSREGGEKKRKNKKSKVHDQPQPVGGFGIKRLKKKSKVKGKKVPIGGKKKGVGLWGGGGQREPSSRQQKEEKSMKGKKRLKGKRGTL